MLTLIIADSRGAGIQDLLREDDNIGRTLVCSHPGAGYRTAISKSISTIISKDPELIIVMAGICDVTSRNPQSKATSLIHHTEREITEHVMTAAYEANNTIKAISRAKVSFATVTGIDLSDYNNVTRRHMSHQEYEDYCATNKRAHPDQELLDTAILTINRKIIELNIKNNSPTTWTASAVHSYFKNSHHHYYRRLRDGCHAHPRTARDWAKFIIKTIRRYEMQD